MADNPFTIGIIQDHATDDIAGNVARAERLVRDAARKGAQIICLKELFNATYFCKAQQSDRFDLAEPIPGPTTERMQAIARELAVVIVVPIFERQAAGLHLERFGDGLRTRLANASAAFGWSRLLQTRVNSSPPIREMKSSWAASSSRRAIVQSSSSPIECPNTSLASLK